MPNLAFGPPNTKNRALWDVPNLKKYATPLQYCLKYETVRTTIAKINIIILLRFSLSSSTNISLSVFSLCHSQTLSHFFSLCHSLSLPSPPCSRKLLKITLQSSLSIFPVLVLHNSPPISRSHSPTLATNIHNPHHRPSNLS